MMDERDKALGMDRPIARRDFLDGIAIGIGAAMTAGFGMRSAADASTAADYPPDRTGLRGQYNATYQIIHQVRDGTFWQHAPAATSTGETYDLVIVGAGISGVSAAYFYQKQKPDARILIVDNCDDFGGHAKRNEFDVDGRTLLKNSGTLWIENPKDYSPVAMGLLRELGVDVNRFYKLYDKNLYKNLSTGLFFGHETFGKDHFVADMPTVSKAGRPWEEIFGNAPLTPHVRAELIRVHTEKVDYLPHLSLEEKRALLSKTSYADYLLHYVKLAPEALPFFQTRTHDLWGVGIDAVCALDCWDDGDDYGRLYPGFQGMDLGVGTGHWEHPRAEPDIFHFPDGNATIARLMMRKLIPGMIPGDTMDDIVTAPCDYSMLDRPGNAVRVRLQSTVVRAKHLSATDRARGVEIAYVHAGELKTVTAKAAVLACFNVVVPYICPELPKAQRDGLAYNVKVPLVYTHVAIRNWKSFEKLGVYQIEAPNMYYNYVALDYPVSIGTYEFPKDPSDPIVLFMLRTPCKPGLPERDQHRVGRAELFTTPYATFERNVRDQLARMLGAGGFDPARDIAALTVNRWSHGYSYEYNSLWDPPWKPGEWPNEIGRKTYGRIAIANSDSQLYAHTDAAIDQAHRAVMSLFA